MTTTPSANVSTFVHPDDKLLGTTDRQATRTVLYVDDHPVNVLLMQALFAKRPLLRLVVASSGEAGLRSATDETPDLLLLDLRLPDCHGSELLQRMHELPALARVPAVAVTAEDTGGTPRGGFAEVWHTPMDPHLTLACLDRLLAQTVHVHTDDEAPTTPTASAGRPWTCSDRSPPAPIPFPSSAPRRAHLAPYAPFDAAR